MLSDKTQNTSYIIMLKSHAINMFSWSITAVIISGTWVLVRIPNGIMSVWLKCFNLLS